MTNRTLANRIASPFWRFTGMLYGRELETERDALTPPIYVCQECWCQSPTLVMCCGFLMDPDHQATQQEMNAGLQSHHATQQEMNRMLQLQQFQQAKDAEERNRLDWEIRRRHGARVPQRVIELEADDES